jgi:hypothetical protein
MGLLSESKYPERQWLVFETRIINGPLVVLDGIVDCDS